MLNLAVPTDDGWFDRVRDHLDVILVDHCHLEKRAASNALNMIFRYTGKDSILRELSDVVQEEMEHFVMCLDLLEARDIKFIRLKPSPYAAKLKESIERQEPKAFLDQLLMAALIEARSCERFKILGDELEDIDPELSAFYKDLVVSEARHHMLYTNIARQFYPADEVKERLSELAAIEADAVASCTDAPRLHSF